VAGLPGGAPIRFDHGKVRELRERGLKYREIAAELGDLDAERGQDSEGAVSAADDIEISRYQVTHLTVGAND